MFMKSICGLKKDNVIEKYGSKLFDINIDDVVREINIRAIICGGAELAGKILSEERIDRLAKRIVEEYYGSE